MNKEESVQESADSYIIERKTVETALRAIGEYKNKSSVLTIAQQKLVAVLYYEEFVSLGNIVRYLKEEENVIISKSAIHKGLFRWKKYISTNKYDRWCLIRNRPTKNSRNPKKRGNYKNYKNPTFSDSVNSLEAEAEALEKRRDSGEEFSLSERKRLAEIKQTLKGKR